MGKTKLPLVDTASCSAAPPLMLLPSTRPEPERPITVPPIAYTPLKVAVTFFAALKEGSEHVLPVQLPEKPENALPVAAVPPRVRLVPESKVRVQSAVQEVAAPPKSTVPAPMPAKVTFTSIRAMKLAFTVASLFKDNAQEAPVQALLKRSKREPEAAAGVSVTAVPSGSWTEQVPLVAPALEVHEIAGVVFDESVPEPLPAAVTVSVCSFTNVAVTFFAAPIVSEQVAPLQSPEKPEKMLPLAGVAVSATAVPMSKLAEHVALQPTPEGMDVTVPDPVPASVTASDTGGVSQRLAVPLAAHA